MNPLAFILTQPQLLAVEIVKADGSLELLTPETHPFLMRAARVNVGRLGIVTRLKFRIIKEVPIKRELRSLPTTGENECVRRCASNRCQMSGEE